MMSNKVYDVLKYVCQILLPACAWLFYELAGIWGIANAEPIVETIVAVDTLIGCLLGISSIQFYRKNKLITIEVKDEKEEVENDEPTAKEPEDN